MKTHFVSFLLLVSVFTKGQDLIILQDPENSYQLLHDGWQYKMGEHPTSVYADFMEEGWKPIWPEADIHDSIPANAKTGIGWMRLRFAVSREARNQQLSMLIKQSIASEIYLNGRIIKQYGNISEEPSKINAFNPLYKPISLILSDDSIQVIAVRFVVQPKVKYITYYGVTNPFFTARLMRNENALEIYKAIYIRPWLDFFMQGIIFMVFILHISFFIMYRKQRANLLFALSALIQAIGSQVHNYYYYMASPEQKFTLAILASVMYAIGNLLMFASILNYLKVQSNTSFRILAGIQFISLVIGALWYRTGFNSLTGFMPIMTYMFILFLSITALSKQVKEAGILTIGFSLSIFAFMIFLGNAILNHDDHLLRAPFNLYSFFFLVYLLAPPGSVSLFLANDFARTSKKLQQKLAEVEMLSEKNVQSEREKQEILSSQNLQLEAKVEERTIELKRSLNELKSTQAQLIQSEKMASLGELTAGIAHEIQNPLNFVNNFSEVNTELIGEIKRELKAGNYPEVELLANDLEANMEKITLHGKRADAIVKSMLQHSRASSGEKELTDINALADEYLRLSYHGMRARDKAFNAELQTDFDENMGNVRVISQDIGRVLLNMYNNAFQAMNEKKREQPVGFDPIVKVTTQKFADTVEIRITDNGNGIPGKIVNKIFQPFFTTKPTGEGTGLGLSLSYDIIKAHGGEINVATKEGIGTEFTIRLAVN